MDKKSPDWFNIAAGIFCSALIGLLVSVIHWLFGVIVFLILCVAWATNPATCWFDNGGPSW